MMTLAEEVVLLALDDARGVLRELPRQTLDNALAGALLMELALCNRVDSDHRLLRLLKTTATGDDLLDQTLQVLGRIGPEHPVADALKCIAAQGAQIRDALLARLVAKGVLKQEKQKFLWVFGLRRYPVCDQREIKEVTRRLRETIARGEIPEARDMVLISLLDACGLMNQLFSAAELEQYQPQIARLAKLDFIGQTLCHALQPIQAELLLMTATSPFPLV